jgi:hypothetical protein
VSATLLPLGGAIRIVVRGAQPARDQRVEGCWAAACEDNPRLFDGPILAVRAIDAGSGVVAASPERFAHVVCPGPGRSMATTILSVTGVIEVSVDGVDHVLLARRGLATRSYPGMWEFAPAGGLHVPASPAVLGLDDVMATLRAELVEEVGVEAPLGGAQAVALVADAEARSLDVIVRARIAGEAPPLRIGGAHAWECAEALWVAISELPAVFDGCQGGVITPTVEVARWLGWLG